MTSKRQRSTRRSHTPQGDTPGKSSQKYPRRNEGSGRRLTYQDSSDDKLLQPRPSAQWSILEKKQMAHYFANELGVSSWPTHRHDPKKQDTWTQCAQFVTDKCGVTRTAASCRNMVFVFKKQFESPDLALEHFTNEGKEKVLAAYEELEENEQLGVIDMLYGLQLEQKGLVKYVVSRPSIPSLSILAMDKLKSLKRPNSVVNMLISLLESHSDGTPRLNLDRMPFELIEANLQFFANDDAHIVKCGPAYRKWLATMYAHFGEKFMALFNGPMWKVDHGDTEKEDDKLIKACNPGERKTTIASGQSQTVSTSSAVDQPSSPNKPSSPIGLPKTSSTPVLSTSSAVDQPSSPNKPSSPIGLPKTSSTPVLSTSSAVDQPSSPNKPSSPIGHPKTSSTAVLSTSSTVDQPSSPNKPSSPIGLPKTSSTPVHVHEKQPTSLWKLVDADELLEYEVEGVDVQQRNKELLNEHGLRTLYHKSNTSRATKEALVNVVGLSSRQMRRDFQDTLYTPGPTIQRPILDQAKKVNPQGRWWIKADACDIHAGLRESVRHDWTGDVDMGDGKVQALHQQYISSLQEINSMSLATVPQVLKQLTNEIKEIDKGTLKSEKIYKKQKAKSSRESTLITYMWDLRGWKDLQEKNKELIKRLQEFLEKGYDDAVFELKSELCEYMKGIFTKRRTVATHLLIFMISDELRNRKPYALPVQMMPVSSVKDAQIRQLQVALKKVMNSMGMAVVGFTTDGEWNTLRTQGQTRPTSLIQLIKQAKVEAAGMKKDMLEKILQPKVEMNNPAPGYLTVTQHQSHAAIPAADITQLGVDIHMGMTMQQALHALHKRLYRHIPEPLPWVPGTTETSLECMRSIMATYLLRFKIESYKKEGVDFSKHLYIPENIDGQDFHDREDHGHLLKRIVKCVRCGSIPDCDIRRYIDALLDKNSGLTAKAVRGTDPQSVPDCERMISTGVIQFFQMKGYDKEAKFSTLMHNWHKATDGRGISEEDRSRYNHEMLEYILDDWMPFHRECDYSHVDVNKPLKGIRGLSRETLIGLTTNICSQEYRRSQKRAPEHPRASTSDDVECFIALLHHMLGRTFDHKKFLDSYRKIFMEFQKMIDDDLPFFYYTGPHTRYTTDPLPDFNQPSGQVERLDRIQYRRFGNVGSFAPSRSAMPRKGHKTIRDKYHRNEEPLPPFHSSIQ